jgi:hypothetical protein
MDTAGGADNENFKACLQPEHLSHLPFVAKGLSFLVACAIFALTVWIDQLKLKKKQHVQHSTRTRTIGIVVGRSPTTTA